MCKNLCLPLLLQFALLLLQPIVFYIYILEKKFGKLFSFPGADYVPYSVIKVLSNRSSNILRVVCIASCRMAEKSPRAFFQIGLKRYSCICAVNIISQVDIYINGISLHSFIRFRFISVVCMACTQSNDRKHSVHSMNYVLVC